MVRALAGIVGRGSCRRCMAHMRRRRRRRQTLSTRGSSHARCWPAHPPRASAANHAVSAHVWHSAVAPLRARFFVSATLGMAGALWHTLWRAWWRSLLQHIDGHAMGYGPVTGVGGVAGPPRPSGQCVCLRTSARVCCDVLWAHTSVRGGAALGASVARHAENGPAQQPRRRWHSQSPRRNEGNR